MKNKFETIEEFYNYVSDKNVEENKLQIILDNDMTSFYINGDEIKVKETNGYCDILPLYKILFKKANVEWC